MSDLKIGKFQIHYHRADNVIPRFPPLAIVCDELHTLVIKTTSEHVAVHIGFSEDGLIQCFLAHENMTIHSEVSHFNHVLLDFNFAGKHFMVLYHPADTTGKDEDEFELTCLGQSCMFSSTHPLHFCSVSHHKGNAMIYPFPERLH